MKFKKYNSIENVCRKKFISNVVYKFPILSDMEYIVTEKIHGANFSIMIDKDNIEYGKRTGKIMPGESFFGYEKTVEKYEAKFKKIQRLRIKDDIKSIILYSEYYGGNVQHEIFYSKDKHIKIFDIAINGELLCQRDTIKFLREMNMLELFVPVIGIFNGLDSALDCSINFDSLVSETKGNLCEGVVIKPYIELFKINADKYFYIKKKNEKFSVNPKNRVHTKYIPTDNFQELLKIYKEYFNKNRIDSVFSKYGVIERMDQIGEYIKYITLDAKEDFLKDYKDEFLALNQKERGMMIKASGAIIMPMLRKEL